MHVINFLCHFVSINLQTTIVDKYQINSNENTSYFKYIPIKTQQNTYMPTS